MSKQQMDEDTRQKLLTIFGRFILAEVPMKEETRTMTVAGQEIVINQITPVDPDNAVLRDLKRTAEDCGMTVRVWWPGIVGTMELNRDRLNVHIEKGGDGKWRIAENMNLDASPALQRTMAEVIARGLDRSLNVRKPLQLKRALTP